jgi:hypothetical protein
MDAKSEFIEEIKQCDWFHTIDFGGGIVTPGALQECHPEGQGRQLFQRVAEG